MKTRESNMFGNRADYSWGIDGNFLWAKDNGGPGRSLTNDLENCLTEIAGEIRPKQLTDYKLIYKDSMGVWDAISILNMKSAKELEAELAWIKQAKEKNMNYWSHWLSVDFFSLGEETSYEKAKGSYDEYLLLTENKTTS